MDLLLQPTAAYHPVLLRGVRFDHRSVDRPHFITDSGDAGPESGQLRAEGQKLIDYFWEKTTLDGTNDFWVNLSPYESNRMLPEVLWELAWDAICLIRIVS